jgi:hypothetical protein
VAASVADILHLEKRWDKLPGASTGSVALEDAKALLGAEVLAVSGWLMRGRSGGRLAGSTAAACAGTAAALCP